MHLVFQSKIDEADYKAWQCVPQILQDYFKSKQYSATSMRYWIPKAVKREKGRFERFVRACKLQTKHGDQTPIQTRMPSIDSRVQVSKQTSSDKENPQQHSYVPKWYGYGADD
ncbi:MAG: hypothetical protein FWF56_03570 [Firmicutes bacterium]|nr:hypothetical protein [Bacillota bacterium]